MKIALPVKARSLQAEISDTFGRTEYFLIYDTENKTAEYIDNSAAASQGGAGIKAAQTVVDQNVEALLTPQCGENAARVMQPNGIRIYKTQGGFAEGNIEAFEKGTLSLSEKIHGGFHGGFHGGRGGQ